MGYKRKVKHYVLQFEDDELEEFECVCGSLSVDEFIEITGLAGRLTARDTETDEVQRLFDILAEKIIRWNLEDDDDKPVPHDAETLRKQDFDFIMAIQMAWMSAMADIAPPLPDGSSNGGTSQDRITTALASMSRSQTN